MYGILVLLLSYSVVCESCFTYDFETRFDEFTNELRTCVGLGMWVSGNYSDLSVDSPHPNSVTFITPASPVMSCVSSFPFPMNSQGYVEVNIFLDPAVTSDQLTVLAFQGIGDDGDPTVGSFSFNAVNPSFGDGWYVIRFAVSGATSFNGYISFIGMASANSILIIDSFRFIPPTINQEDNLCDIYKEGELTTTTVVTEPNETTSVSDLITETTPAPELTDTTTASLEISIPTENFSTETSPTTTEISTITEIFPSTSLLESSTSEPSTTADISTTAALTADTTTQTTTETTLDTSTSGTSLITDIASTIDDITTELSSTVDTTTQITTQDTSILTETTPTSYSPTSESSSTTMTTSDTTSAESFTITEYTVYTEGYVSSTTSLVLDTSTSIPTQESSETVEYTSTDNKSTTPILTETTLRPETETTTATYTESTFTTEILLTTTSIITDEPSTATSITTDISSTGIPSTIDFISVTSTTTQEPKNPPESLPVMAPNSTFWNTLTITMMVLISFILLCLIYFAFYQLGKSKAKKDEAPTIIMGQPELPSSIIMPRVKNSRVTSFIRGHHTMPV